MIRVVIVDDSATMRVALTRVLTGDPEIEVLASFGDPVRALSQIIALKPDVVTVDVDMPGMDGIAFVRALHRVTSCPVVMISALTTSGSRTTFDALDAGAVDFVAKPKDLSQLQLLAEELPHRLKNAARTKVPARGEFDAVTGLSTPRATLSAVTDNRDSRVRLVVIGGSTGAPQILPEVLSRLSATSVPVAIAIHMPAGFTRTYAERLQSMLKGISVTEAKPGQIVRAGQVVIAPGDYHLKVLQTSGSVRLWCDPSPPIQHHRPSIDALFESCARNFGASGLGVLLTGMGQDGAGGMLKMKEAGSTTLVQDPKSCMVDGMPQTAIDAGGVSEVLGLWRIASRLGQLVC